jgi:hypothetical protein
MRKRLARVFFKRHSLCRLLKSQRSTEAIYDKNPGIILSTLSNISLCELLTARHMGDLPKLEFPNL